MSDRVDESWEQFLSGRCRIPLLASEDLLHMKHKIRAIKSFCTVISAVWFLTLFLGGCLSSDGKCLTLIHRGTSCLWKLQKLHWKSGMLACISVFPFKLSRSTKSRTLKSVFHYSKQQTQSEGRHPCLSRQVSVNKSRLIKITVWF